MANRRMFSMKIVDTDAFLDMPQSSQLLYFHLNMRADDDGFASNPKKVMRMIGSSDDDHKLLIAKKFIIPFESGVCVIKHWLVHNLVRSDRYTETQYTREKSFLIIDEKTKKYSLNKGENHVIPLGNQMEPQVRLGKVRLGKVRLGKDNNTGETSSPQIPLLIKSFENINPASKRFYGNTTQREACDSLLKQYGFERVTTVIEKTLPKTNALEFFPTITTPLQLYEKWSSLESAIKKHQSKTIKNQSNIAFK